MTFACDGSALAGTIDPAPSSTGLIIVSGGNEIRSGSWAGQALLATRIAAGGHPVLRFDRRGVGDSEGDNRGFRSSAKDLAAAIEAFTEHQPQLRRIVAFGNCDAASGLALFAAEAGLDGLVLANPWTLEGDDTAVSPAAVRRRYWARLSDLRQLRRLFTGGVDLGKVARGLKSAVARSPESTLAAEMRERLSRFGGRATILLAERDRTAELFLAVWDDATTPIERCLSASHSFAEGAAFDWLTERVLAALARE
ncbi:hydrolase 1, exosortase A system-associated [Novosphingobium tardum]|uniref:Hydrolase 1, exosortase A system-associated n=1 Tax=Novosphingobium tardum TaxID=1538021 RepID=A0ABV8RQH5_9SPHN